MGLWVVLEDEKGHPIQGVEGVADPRNLLHRLLPSREDRSYQCLRFVDWYGDTVFNYLQADQLLVELERVASGTTTEEERELLRRLRELAQMSQESRAYVKFYGD